MVENMKPSPKAKKRNIGLSIWVALMLLGSAWAALANFGVLFGPAYSFMPNWILFMMGLLGVVNVVFLVNILQWKMWAFKGLLATAVIAFVLNLIAGVSFFAALFGFIGVGILYLFMRPQWNFFE